MNSNIRTPKSSNGTEGLKSTTSTPKWKYHVFLSFRGEDTRKGFTDHLYAALCKKGFKTFRDDNELEKGEVISTSLLEAIKGSLFAIVVVSQNYASSSWCLDELQQIIDPENEQGCEEIFPIFYGIDPSVVRHQKGSFAEAFAKHEEKFGEEQWKVHRWRDSLTMIANISGWDSKDWHESELIEEVVKSLWSKLRSKLPSYNGILVGMDPRLEVMDSLLGIGLDDVRFVGIWGMGGVGKTTLASVVYERLLGQFEICCFLGNVREVSEKSNGLIDLQTKILSQLKVKGMIIDNTYGGKSTIQNLCCNKMVLLVLDDVNLNSQLENLAGSKDWFGLGSRIIITTRDCHLLKSHGARHIYKAEIMNQDESLDLFYKRAFRGEQPKEAYLKLSEAVVNYAGGLPLALQVLGSLLYGRSVPQWEETLNKLKQVPEKDIFRILKISYDGLGDSEKATFLDISCFFKMWDKDQVTHVLKICGLYPLNDIPLLIEKSLLSEVVANGGVCIDMHDLIQEMGRRIVFEESPNIGKRSRLWSPKDIDKVLKRNMGTELIQGVVFPNNSQSYGTYCDPKAFSKMLNLRLLIVHGNLNPSCGLKCLSSELKFLLWHRYPLEALPLGVQLDELVYLQMHDSKLKKLWNGVECLEKLEFMDLSHSKYLTRTPDFLGVPNLEKLILEACTRLVKIHPSCGQNKNLLVVNLKGCTSLESLPQKLEMTLLREFILCGCTKIKKLPEFGENMGNLVALDLEETAIAKLPASLGFLTGLETLNVKGCKKLVCLPHTIKNLKLLKNLDISDCPKFSKLPENLNENVALEKLDLSGTAITNVPSSIGELEKLTVLSFHGCKGISWHWFPNESVILPPIFKLKSLTQLDLSFCNIGDEFIPEDLGGLSSLEILDLRGNNFMNLPRGCILNLLKLQYLYLRCCPRLQSLPQSSPSLELMDAGDCASMEPILSDEQLWYLFGSLVDECVQYAQAAVWSYSYFEGKVSDSAALLIKDFAATIPGREIPSWFENENYLSVRKGGESSIIIDVPQSNSASDWLGFALCLVLDDKFYSLKKNGSQFRTPCWYYDCVKASKDNKFEYLVGWQSKIGSEIYYPHLGILFLQITKKNGLELSMDYNQLHLKFYGNFLESQTSYERFPLKCQWRLISKEDFEEWRKIRGQSHLTWEGYEERESSSCLEEEGHLDESWMSFNTEASITQEGEQMRISSLNMKRKGEAMPELSSSFDTPNKKWRTSNIHIRDISSSNCINDDNVAKRVIELKSIGESSSSNSKKLKR